MAMGGGRRGAGKRGSLGLWTEHLHGCGAFLGGRRPQGRRSGGKNDELWFQSGQVEVKSLGREQAGSWRQGLGLRRKGATERVQPPEGLAGWAVWEVTSAAKGKAPGKVRGGRGKRSTQNISEEEAREQPRRGRENSAIKV